LQSIFAFNILKAHKTQNKMLPVSLAFVLALTVVAVVVFCWKTPTTARSRPSTTPSPTDLLFRRIDEWEATPNSGSFYDFCFDVSAYKNVAD
jgi:hypothetical protein